MIDLNCTACNTYVERRLATVLRLWFAETGQRVRVGAFMRGVHARHEAGLPIGVNA